MDVGFERPLVRYLNTWKWPFAFVLSAPLITVPATLMMLQALSDSCVGQAVLELVYLECSTPDVLKALLPGLLNLLPLMWLRLGSRVVREAALVAGSCGMIRLAVVMASYALAGAAGSIQFLSIPFVGTVPTSGPGDPGGLLWLLTLITMLCFGWAKRRNWIAQS
jgi:hypothetical protein